MQPARTWKLIGVRSSRRQSRASSRASGASVMPRNHTGADLLTRILEARRAGWERAELSRLEAKGKRPRDHAWKAAFVEPNGPDVSGLPLLPQGWAWATLPQLGEFGRGKSRHRPRNDPKLYGGPYPFIQTGEVRRSNGRITQYDQTYNGVGLAQSRLWPAGTVCITIAANIAETSILTFPACFPDSVVGLIATDQAVADYVELFMRMARDRLDRFAPATVQKNINLEILEALAVPLPPHAELNEIVRQVRECLSAAEGLTCMGTRASQDAARLCQSLLTTAFAGKLVPQHPEDEPASRLLERLRTDRPARTKGARRGRSASM